MKKRPAAASRPSAASAKSVEHSAAAAVKEEPVDTDVGQPLASSSKQVEHNAVTAVKAESADLAVLQAAAEKAATKPKHKELVSYVVGLL